MSNYFLVLLAIAVRLWPEGRFWPPAPMVKAEAAPAVAVAKLSREESHSLQAATTLSTSSAEPPTLREVLGGGDCTDPKAGGAAAGAAPKVGVGAPKVGAGLPKAGEAAPNGLLAGAAGG